MKVNVNAVSYPDQYKTYSCKSFGQKYYYKSYTKIYKIIFRISPLKMVLPLTEGAEKKCQTFQSVRNLTKFWAKSSPLQKENKWKYYFPSNAFLKRSAKCQKRFYRPLQRERGILKPLEGDYSIGN